MMKNYILKLEGSGCKTTFKVSSYKDFMTTLCSTLKTEEVSFQLVEVPELAGGGVFVTAVFLDMIVILRVWSKEKISTLIVMSYEWVDNELFYKSFNSFFKPKTVNLKEME